MDTLSLLLFSGRLSVISRAVLDAVEVVRSAFVVYSVLLDKGSLELQQDEGRDSWVFGIGAALCSDR